MKGSIERRGENSFRLIVSDGVDVQQMPEGIMGVMRKPFTIRQLSRCVRLALSGSRLEDVQT